MSGKTTDTLTQLDLTVAEDTFGIRLTYQAQKYKVYKQQTGKQTFERVSQ